VIGHHCTGAKVNGRMVNLRYKLRNGEICEIVTSKDQGPSRDWLGFVKTSRAKNRIRHWLNVTEKERSLELGKKLMEREARRYKVSIKKAFEVDNLSEIFKEYGVQKLEDLYSALGFGKFSARQVLFRLHPELESQQAEPADPAAKESTISSVVRRVLGRGDSPISVKGSNDMLVYLAKCCNPIRGEEIAGYITRGKGISVHAVNCPNMDSLLSSPDRRIEVRWADAKEAGGYSEKLVVMTENRQGVLADITKAIADIQTNIRDIRATTTEESQGIVDITVEIRDIQHLQKVIQCLKEIKGVYDVERRHKGA
jgi:guanosine-3',5'-bis(diphosphate) 3'-pyrophosphohydrolase